MPPKHLPALVGMHGGSEKDPLEVKKREDKKKRALCVLQTYVGTWRSLK